MPEDAHPRPPTPSRRAPRSVDLRIISRSSATPRKAEGGRKGRSQQEKGSHNLGHRPMRPSKGFRQTSTFQIFPSSGVSAINAYSWHNLIDRSLADPSNALRGPSHNPTASNQPRAVQPKRIQNVLRQEGNLPGSSRRVIYQRRS
jgi:hypothetical protein